MFLSASFSGNFCTSLEARFCVSRCRANHRPQRRTAKQFCKSSHGKQMRVIKSHGVRVPHADGNLLRLQRKALKERKKKPFSQWRICLWGLKSYIRPIQKTKVKKKKKMKWQTRDFVTVPSGHRSPPTWCFPSKRWSPPPAIVQFVQLSRRRGRRISGLKKRTRAKR